MPERSARDLVGFPSTCRQWKPVWRPCGSRMGPSSCRAHLIAHGREDVDEFLCQALGISQRLLKSVDLGCIELVKGKPTHEHALKCLTLVELGPHQRQSAGLKCVHYLSLNPRGDDGTRPR